MVNNKDVNSFYDKINIDNNTGLIFNDQMDENQDNIL